MSGGPDKGLADRLSFYLLKKVNKAIREHRLIEEGDRVAVAVSGGKDSLGLLRLLRDRQRSARERYELVALHVLDEAQRGQSGCPAELEEWLQHEVGEYHLLDMDISEDEPRPLNCFRCSWHRRKALFRAAHRLGCPKLALAHHADDAAQTALLNLFYHGRLETIEPRVSFFGGQVIVIRPLIRVPEKEMMRFARASAFPVCSGCCPREDESRRERMKELMREVERDMPRARINLLRAVDRCRVAERGQQQDGAGASGPLTAFPESG
jgi:tRNA 2-thiocytidine biosynthesis protein TtcA